MRFSLNMIEMLNNLKYLKYSNSILKLIVFDALFCTLILHPGRNQAIVLPAVKHAEMDASMDDIEWIQYLRAYQKSDFESLSLPIPSMGIAGKNTIAFFPCRQADIFLNGKQDPNA